MGQLQTLVYGSAPYHIALWRPTPRAEVPRIGPLWPGSRERGAALVAGMGSFDVTAAETPSPPWDADRPDAWRARLHGFGWLSDLAAFGGEAATRQAQEWTADWVRRFDIYDSFAWRAAVMGDRLFAWLENFALLTSGDGLGAERQRFLACLARQARHLVHVAGHEASGLDRLRALRGGIAACAALGWRRALARVLRHLARALDDQVLGDGGHRGRGPVAQLEALRLMVEMRAALIAVNAAVPGFLVAAMERAGPMLRFFRHGDGRMGLFNGADEGDPAFVDLVLARAGVRGRVPLSAPDTGFERLQAGGTVVLFDCGPLALPGFDETAHAGLLAFEMSHARERIIVNCGAYRGPDAAWRAAMRATAAHSTVVVADTNAAEIRPDGTIGARPTTVTHKRAEDSGNLLAAATHDGYRALGLVHNRQLFLAADGDDFRGEDRLTGTAGRGFAIRFHLHPGVEAALQAEANSVLLTLPSGAQWRFRADGAVLGLAESVYMGADPVQKTQQIVLDGHAGSTGATVRWAVKRA